MTSYRKLLARLKRAAARARMAVTKLRLRRRSRIVALAEWAARQPGAATSYLYGGVPGIGAGTHTDCSGFVLAVYDRAAGMKLPRTSQEQYAAGKKHPDRAQLKRGDLVFFNYEGPHSHVGIYVGNGAMIADQHTGSGIVRVPVDWAHFDGAASFL